MEKIKMSHLLYLCAAALLLLFSAVCLVLTLYWGYKHNSLKGVLFSAGCVVLVPVCLSVLLFCIALSVLFTDDLRPNVLLGYVGLPVWFIGSFVPFGVTTAKGFKSRNMTQSRAGIWGVATVASFMAALGCLAYFSYACT